MYWRPIQGHNIFIIEKVQPPKHKKWISFSHSFNSNRKNCQTESWTLHVGSLELTYGYLYHTWLMVPHTWPKINYSYNYGAKNIWIIGHGLPEYCRRVSQVIANFSKRNILKMVGMWPGLHCFLSTINIRFNQINLSHSTIRMIHQNIKIIYE